MACARSRGGRPSGGTNIATEPAPRSRARRTAAAAPRRTGSASMRPRARRRGPRPTTSTRSAGIAPPVCRSVIWPALPSNFSAARTRLSRPPRARSTAATSATGRGSPAYRPSTSTSARASTGFRASSDTSMRYPFPVSAWVTARVSAARARRVRSARHTMSASPSVVSYVATWSMGTQRTSAASLPARGSPDSMTAR